MGQQLRKNRKWETRNFVSGGQEVINLPIGDDVESLMLYLSGNIVIGTQFTGIKTEGLAKLIKRVSLLMDGETIADLTGDFLTHGNFAREGGLIKTNPGVTVATHACEIVGFLDLANIGGVRPKDTNLRTKGKSQFQLLVTWGTFADMFTGAGAVTSNTLALKVSVRETKEPEGSKAPEAKRLYRFIDRTYAADTEERIKLDANVLYRGLMLRCESGGDLSAAVLKDVKVQIGSDIPFNLDAAQIIDNNTQDNGFALPAGYYFVDFAPAPSGQVKIADFLDLHGHDDAYLILNVTGGATNKIQIVPHQFQWIHEAIADNRRK